MERNRTGDPSQLEVVLTRLQPMRLPAQAARQLSDQSTTLRVDSSSTGDSRLRGALPLPDSCSATKEILFDHVAVCRDFRALLPEMTQWALLAIDASVGY
jgi:hypothetical protein